MEEQELQEYEKQVNLLGKKTKSLKILFWVAVIFFAGFSLITKRFILMFVFLIIGITVELNQQRITNKYKKG